MIDFPRPKKTGPPRFHHRDRARPDELSVGDVLLTVWGAVIVLLNH
ncbi:hypothetical protein ACH4MN_28295 [Streptomyces anulatus]